MDALFEQVPAFAQIGRRLCLEDELNFLRDVLDRVNLQGQRHPLIRTHRIDRDRKSRRFAIYHGLFKEQCLPTARRLHLAVSPVTDHQIGINRHTDAFELARLVECFNKLSKRAISHPVLSLHQRRAVLQCRCCSRLAPSRRHGHQTGTTERRGYSCLLAVRRDQVLERDYPSVRKGDGLIRVSDGRNVGIEKRIVEWIAEKYEPPATMASEDSASKAEPAKSIWSIGITKSGSVTVTAVAIGAGRRVNPGFSRVAVHVAGYFLVGRTPREPNGILRHTATNLATTNQSLVVGRKRSEDLR